jgi:sn-1 stearoyl-lipid 9-desaturase
MNTQIRLVQWLNHLPALYGIYYVLSTNEFFWLIVTAVAFLILGPISTVVTLHRLLTHRSFETYKWMEKVLSFITIFSTLGPTIAWVGLHRYHHLTADTDKDPHSPYNGVLKSWLGYGWKVENIPLNFVKDLMKDNYHKWIFKNYFKVLILCVGALILIDPIAAIFLYFLPATLVFHGTGAVNFFGHWHGYRNYETNDRSTNSWLANLISLGDGWHNNHHRHPRNFTTKEKWWEWDLMALFIRMVKR